MGQQWNPNRAFSTPVLKALLQEVERRVQDAEDESEENRWVVRHAFCVVTYVLSLRGPEGFLLELEGLNRFWNDRDPKKIIVTLLGKVKGEQEERWHLLPCIKVTSTGINVAASVKRLRDLKANQGFRRGPAISDYKGDIYSSREVDDTMQEALESVYNADKELFPESIKTVEDMKKSYHCFRSFRRASDTRALESKVNTDDIKLVNRWSTREKLEGRRPNQEMHFYYADIALLEAPFLRYTQAM